MTTEITTCLCCGDPMPDRGSEYCDECELHEDPE